MGQGIEVHLQSGVGYGAQGESYYRKQVMDL